MSSRTFNIFKALFFVLLAAALVAYQLRSPSGGSKWAWVGILISVIAAIGYLKQAFNK